MTDTPVTPIQPIDWRMFRGKRIRITPHTLLTPEEIRDRSYPGNPGFIPRVNAAGVYRDCRACLGWGKFPGPEGAEPCEFCEVTAKEDFEKFTKESPAATFLTDNPAEMALLKEKFNPEALAKATASGESFEQHWQDTKLALANIEAEKVPHYVFQCRQCDTIHKRPVDPGLGKWDRSSNHRVICCEERAHFLNHITPPHAP